MDDFILRKAALDSLCSGCEYVPIEEKENCPYRFTGCQEYENIFAIPAADVRPVILCRNCFFYRKDPELARANYMNPDEYCSLHQAEFAEEGFCSYGKEKGNG